MAAAFVSSMGRVMMYSVMREDKISHSRIECKMFWHRLSASNWNFAPIDTYTTVIHGQSERRGASTYDSPYWGARLLGRTRSDLPGRGHHSIGRGGADGAGTC